MAKTQLVNRGVSMKGLTDKQRCFVYEYTIDYNATRAAKKAGYKNPAAMGARLLDPKYNPKICKAVGRIQKQNVETAILTKEQILEELSTLAMRDVIELCDEEGVFVVDDLRKLPPSIRRCIDGLEVDQKFNKSGDLVGQRIKLKLVAKLGAIDMLAKHFGLFAPQEHKVTHAIDWDKEYGELNTEEDIIEGIISEVEEDAS